MQAITTKYLGPTNTKGARIQARMGDIRLTVPYRHDLSGSGVHAVAAMALARERGYGTCPTWACAATNEGYVFISTSTHMGDHYAVEFA